MLEQITPLILTYNEKANIERTLSKLAWAREIVVVDSFSTDDTVERAQQFSQVRVFQRAFDTHAKQWNFGLKETGIATDWVLALDADYLLSDMLIEELQKLNPDSTIAGYRARFRYHLLGKQLRGQSLSPRQCPVPPGTSGIRPGWTHSTHCHRWSSSIVNG